MKICNKCKEEKSLFDFNKNKHRKDGLQTNCRDCTRKHSKEYFHSTGEMVNQRERVKKRKEKTKLWLRELKSGLKCEKCDFDHPAILDFHHNDPELKEFTISEAPSEGYSKKRILEEMAKCEVLCSNCHRIEHYEERQK